MTTNSCIYRYLCWWGYFQLLEKSGVKEIEIALPGAEKSGKMLSGDAASWFEREADKLGELFGKARKKYDYMSIKDSYRRCIDISDISGE